MAKKKPQPNSLTKRPAKTPAKASLLGDLRQLIEATREQSARAVNSTLVIMYWRIGQRIRADVLQNERAEYGKEILQTLSEELTKEYGRGFGRSNLFAMVQFNEVFPEVEIVQTLSGQLSWSHFVELIPLEDPLKRDFYAEICRVERWSVRTLRHKIGHLLYEGTAVSKKPDVLIAKDIAALRDDDRLTTSCSTIAGCGVWWRLISSSASFKPPTKGRWNSISAGWKSTMSIQANNRPSA